MHLHHQCSVLSWRQHVPVHRGLVLAAAASKTTKGFGKPQKQSSGSEKHGREEDKQILRDAAAATSTRHKSRPVFAEEASRGKYDYVQVADWGDGDRAKLGELRLVSHVPQYEGGGSSGKEAGKEASERPFHVQLAHQLKLAEARGALAIAGPPPPPLSEWSFREARYVQYLADQLEVHTAMEAALQEAVSGLPTSSPPHTAATAHQHASLAAPPAGQQPATTAPAAAPSPAPPATAPPAGVRTDSDSDSAAASAGLPGSAPSPPPPPPVQCAFLALRHLAPGWLGLERSGPLRRDLEALGSSGDHPAAVEARAAAATAAAASSVAQRQAGDGKGTGKGRKRSPAPAEAADKAGRMVGNEKAEAEATARQAGAGRVDVHGSAAGPMARSYGQYLRRLARVAASGESEQERQVGALRLLSHAAVLHMVGQAAGVRLGAVATERLALLPRRAATTYHHYPDHVTDPRATLSAALDAAGEHLHSPAVRQVVFEEIPGAMQKTGLLMTALAHRD